MRKVIRRRKEGKLTEDERRIVKALLEEGWRNQDIQALLNIGRIATVNSARITEVKGDAGTTPASAEELEFYKLRKNSYDSSTGLNLYDDERLIRSRESMLMAVQVFNSSTLMFKTETFSVLSIIAWTYLLHEYYERKSIPITRADGLTLALSSMLERDDCPLGKGIKNNLRALKEIRDEVEHRLLGRSDKMWLDLFQANCLNYDATIRHLFGDRLGLQRDLSLALQFGKLNIDQIATISKFDIPEAITALDARLKGGLEDEELSDLEYQFKVIYTMDASSKGKAHIEFVHPGSEAADAIRHVLVTYKTSDHLYPYKPSQVAKKVTEITGIPFSARNHTQAWIKYKVRPFAGAVRPADARKEYCIFHASHNDYTYSDAWIEFLCKQVQDDTEYKAIKAVKMR